MERGIPHLVKFLRKLSEIKGDKNFFKRGEVDVIKFRPLIKILLIKILVNGTITGLSLSLLGYKLTKLHLIKEMSLQFYILYSEVHFEFSFYSNAFSSF